MAVNIRAQVIISGRLQEAMKKAPEIVGDELTEGMKKIATIRDDVRQNITAAKLFERGRLLRSVRARVKRDAGRANVTGVVQSGARHAGIHEHGGTIKAKGNGFLVFPVGERVLITHTQRRNGEWRELKRPKVETIAEKWIRVKSVEIKPTWYFRRGTKQGLPVVETSLEHAAYRALHRVFGDEQGAVADGE